MSFQKIREALAINIKLMGFSLLEMNIIILISTIIILTCGTFYKDFYQSYSKQNERLALQKNAHLILNYLQQHIQHISYQGKNRMNHNYHLFFENKSYHIEKNCFIFPYDLNSDGCIGNRNKNHACYQHNQNNTTEIGKEIFGFKLENNMLYVYSDNKQSSCHLTACKTLINTCHSNRWEKITENQTYLINKLNFNWIIVDELLKVELQLQSNSQQSILYSAEAYIYILNSKDKGSNRE